MVLGISVFLFENCNQVEEHSCLITVRDIIKKVTKLHFIDVEKRKLRITEKNNSYKYEQQLVKMYSIIDSI